MVEAASDSFISAFGINAARVNTCMHARTALATYADRHMHKRGHTRTDLNTCSADLLTHPLHVGLQLLLLKQIGHANLLIAKVAEVVRVLVFALHCKAKPW